MSLSLSLSLWEKRNTASSLSVEGLQPNTNPFMCGCRSVMAVTLLQLSRAVSLRPCLPGCSCQSELLLLIFMQSISVLSETSFNLRILLKMNTFHVSFCSDSELKLWKLVNLSLVIGKFLHASCWRLFLASEECLLMKVSSLFSKKLSRDVN